MDSRLKTAGMTDLGGTEALTKKGLKPIRSDNRILPKRAQEVSLFFPHTGAPDFVVEAKLYYRYPVALAKPEEITQEMASATGPRGDGARRPRRSA